MNAPLLRVPPHSIEAEQSLLGALLLDNQALDRMAFLDAEHFYRDDHRRIFRCIVGMLERGAPADIITVRDALNDCGDLDKINGGAVYLAQLATNSPGSINAGRYAAMVRDKALQREIAQRATEIAEHALAGVLPPMELSEEAVASFLGIQQQTDQNEAVEFGRALVEAVDRADNPVAGGLVSGYRDLDRILKVMTPGDFVIVAGRPSMGKTALAMNIAEHVAIKDTTAIFSIEMTRVKIAGRSLRYHEHKLGRDAAVDHISGLKLFIDDSASMTLGQMRVRSRKIQRKHGLKLIVVDYLQQVQAKGENRTQEVSAISRGLKALAKDLGVVVLAVAQLNRVVEANADPRPHLSHLRESGQIEQDADVIAFVYREDYYRPDTEWRGIAEVIVRKQRDGAIGTAYLEWQPEFTRFSNLERPLPVPRAPDPETPRRTVVKGDFKRAAAADS